MPDAKMKCPNPDCSSADVRFRPKLKDWTCDECGHNWKAPAPVDPPRSLHIFLSYGHDEHTESALRIKADLEARGHKVWFDAERLREGRDWEQYIEEGLQSCDKVVLLMTPHSVRRRNPRDPATRDGYCLNEIAKAIEKNKLIVPAMLVTLEDGPPTSICRIQYLDLRDCVPIAGNEDRYRVRFERLARAIEQDDLDFEGGQARLQRLLRPLSFEAEMSRHIARFTGRQWLVAEIDRWLVDNPASRVFWLSGPPGIGKSAMATHLVHRRGDVIGYHLCVHGHDDKGDPSRAVLSLAYQVAQHLPEYDKALKALDLEQEVGKNAGTLFDNLFVKPLSGNFPAPDGPRLLVIDAIDEATRGGRNEIAELIRDHWDKVPSWLRLVITSRPEVEVVTTLGHLKPWVLDAQRAENLEDLRRYLERELASRNLPHDERTVAAILAASEAVFLYVVVLLEEIDQGRMSLDHLDDLPVGLAGHYQRFFTRQYPDGSEYQAAIAPLLQCICAAREPLPLDVLARATDLSSNQVRARLVRLGSMFPIRKVPNQEDTIRPFHKSVRDWLTALDDNTHLPRAGGYSVDADSGEKRLAEACWAEYKFDVGEVGAYSFRHLPGHLVAAGRGGDAAKVMTDFGYHYQRLKVLGREDVVNVTSDLALVGAVAGLSLPLRDRVSVWEAFHAENAHLLRRLITHLAPETYLLQLAVAHATKSPVTESAERWLDVAGTEGYWLRSFRRSHEIRRSACRRTLEGHTNDVVAIALLPDGKRVVSGSWDATLKLWNLETGQCLRTLEGHTASVSAIALLPDGKRVVSGSWDATLKLWDLEAGQCLRTLEGHTRGVRVIALLPDGERVISGGTDRTLKLWNLETGQCLRTFEGPWDSVLAAAALPDSRRALSGSISDHTLRLWDLETGECLCAIDAHVGGENAVAVLLDGKRALSVNRDHALKIWDLGSGQSLRTLEGHTSPACAIALLPDGKRALSGSKDGTLKLWNLETGACLLSTDVKDLIKSKYPQWDWTISASPEGRRAVFRCSTGGRTGLLGSWDLEAGQSPRILEVEKATPIRCAIVVLPGGQRALSTSANRTLKLWDLGREHQSGGRGVTGEEDSHETKVRAVALSFDGRHALSGSVDGVIKEWNLQSGDCVRTLQAGNRPVVTLLPDCRRALMGSAGGGDWSLAVWDLQSNCGPLQLYGHTHVVQAAVLSSDGRRCLSGSLDYTLRLWDLNAGAAIRTFVGHSGGVRAVALFSNDACALSGANDHVLMLWDLGSGKCLRVFEGHTGSVCAVAVLPGDRRALSGSRDGTLRYWDLMSGECLLTLNGHTDGVLAVALTPDGRRAISGSEDCTARLWDLDTGQCIATWQGGSPVGCCGGIHDAIIAGTSRGEVLFLRIMPPGRVVPEPTAATWHPMSPLLGVSHADGTLMAQAWHPEAQHLEEVAHTTIPSVTSIQWSSDGTRLLATTRDGATHVLDGATLQPASAPSCAWLPATDTSSDGRWRAILRDGRLEIVPANT